MLIKINKTYILLYIFLLSLFSNILPYLLGLGGENIFLKDFYAKRIMVVATLPLFILYFVSN
jgi:hypothetical protein